MVVGGGEVAFRKVKALLECGAKVTVVSPSLHQDLANLAEEGEIELVRREYRPQDLKDAFLTIAATSENKTNQKVASEAKRRKALVNVVDDPEFSDFIVPSCLRRGDLKIAVSTASKSPALAKKIRTQLEQSFGEEYSILLSLVEEVRSELKQQGLKVSADAWQETLDLDLLIGFVREGKPEKAKSALLSRLKKGELNEALRDGN